MADRDLTTEEGVLSFIRKWLYPSCSMVRRLPEGFGGFVYRVDLGSANEPPSVILKHAENYAARSPSWKLDPTRMKYEARMLKLLSQPDLQGDGIVHVPRMLRYDEETYTMIMEDVGALPSLKGWFVPSVDSSVCASIGDALGRYLAKFHNFTAEHRDTILTFNENITAKNLSSTLYFGRLPSVAAEFGFTDSCFEEAARAGEREVQESQEVLTLGDFWTGNVLVSTTPKLRLFALDFELSKPGTAAFDIGQMAAEMYCLAAFRDYDKGMIMLEAFLTAYKQESESKRSIDALKVAIRIGAHLLVIMPRAWGTEGGDEKVREVAGIGAELVRLGCKRSADELQRSIVNPLLS